MPQRLQCSSLARIALALMLGSGNSTPNLSGGGVSDIDGSYPLHVRRSDVYVDVDSVRRQQFESFSCRRLASQSCLLPVPCCRFRRFSICCAPSWKSN